MGDQIIDAHNGEVVKTPEFNSDSEHYTPTVEVVEGEKNFTISPNYPEYFTRTDTARLNTTMGRWNAGNLSNLGDTLEFKVTSADITAPNVTAPADKEIGYNVDTSTDNLGKATATDDSPYPLSSWIQDSTITNDGNYKVIERTHFEGDVSGNVGSDIQKITIDLNVEVDDFDIAGQFDVKKYYPNPVGNNLNVEVDMRNEGKVHWEIYNMNGVMVNDGTDYMSQGHNKTSINTQGLKSGSYQIIMTSIPIEYSKCIKFIKTH